jgi:hypothetical protein
MNVLIKAKKIINEPLRSDKMSFLKIENKLRVMFNLGLIFLPLIFLFFHQNSFGDAPIPAPTPKLDGIGRFIIPVDKCPLKNTDCCNKCCLNNADIKKLEEIGTKKKKAMYGDKDFYMSRWSDKDETKEMKDFLDGENDKKNTEETVKMFKQKFLRRVSDQARVGSGAYMVMQTPSNVENKVIDEKEIQAMINKTSGYAKDNPSGYFNLIDGNKAKILSKNDPDFVKAVNYFGYELAEGKNGKDYVKDEEKNGNFYTTNLDTQFEIEDEVTKEKVTKKVSMNLFYINCQAKLRQNGTFIPLFYDDPSIKSIPPKENPQFYAALQSPAKLVKGVLDMGEMVKENSCLDKESEEEKKKCQCRIVKDIKKNS